MHFQKLFCITGKLTEKSSDANWLRTVLSSGTLSDRVAANTMLLQVLFREKSVGTTELYYSTKKRKHSFSILTAFFVRHSSEYETSDNFRSLSDVSYSDECRTKKAFSMLKECFRFFVLYFFFHVPKYI